MAVDDDGFERIESKDADGFERVESAREAAELTAAPASPDAWPGSGTGRRRSSSASAPDTPRAPAQWREGTRFELVAADQVVVVRRGGSGFHELRQVARPVVTFTEPLRPSEGSDLSDSGRDVEVEMFCITPGCRIVFTTDGNAPTRTSAVYKEKLRWKVAGCTFRAMALRTGMLQSEVCVAVCPLRADSVGKALYAGLSTEAAHLLGELEERRRAEQKALERRLQMIENRMREADPSTPYPVQPLVARREGSGSELKEFHVTTRYSAAERAEQDVLGVCVFGAAALVVLAVHSRDASIPQTVHTWVRPSDRGVAIAGIRSVTVHQPEISTEEIEINVGVRLRALLHQMNVSSPGCVQGLSWETVQSSADDARVHLHIVFYSEPWHARTVMTELEAELGVGTLHGTLSVQDVPMIRCSNRPPSPKHEENSAWTLDYTNAVKIRRSVDAGSRLSLYYVLMVSIAAIVAGLGLATDSAVAVVASMLISPIMGPILGSVLGALCGSWRSFAWAFLNEIVSLLICIVWGLLVAFCFVAPPARAHSHYGWPTDQMADRGVAYGLVIGVLIAIPSGAGVALSIINANANSLVGVAISASLLPPAVNAGMYLGYAALEVSRANGTVPGDGDLVGDGMVSLALTGLNIVCIFVSAFAVFKVVDVVLNDHSVENRLRLTYIEKEEDDSGWWKGSGESSVQQEPKRPEKKQRLEWRRPARPEQLSVDSREDAVSRACAVSAIACKKFPGRVGRLSARDVAWTEERAKYLGCVGRVDRRIKGVVGYHILLVHEDGEELWWPKSTLHPTCPQGHALRCSQLPTDEQRDCDRCHKERRHQGGRFYRCSGGCDYELCRLCFDPTAAAASDARRRSLQLAKPGEARRVVAQTPLLKQDSPAPDFEDALGALTTVIPRANTDVLPAMSPTARDGTEPFGSE